MKTFLFSILIALTLNGYSQTLISKNSWFLGASNKLGLVAYFQSDSNEPDEYIEGKIFIYDINKNKSYPLNGNNYILDFLNISWPSKSDAFVISSGSSLDYYSFITNERNNLFSADDTGVINSFSISNNGNFIALNEKVFKKGNNYQVFYLIDLKKDSIQKVFTIEDSSIGESLRNNFLFDSMDKNIFIKTITGEVICYNIESSSHKIIDCNAKKMFCISGSNLYYQKDKSLIQYDLINMERIKIIEEEKGNSLDIQYVNGAKGNDIVINFNDNVFFYDENSGLKKGPNLPKGEYVYINSYFAIETLENSLYLHFF